jgi:hypothetical protein
MGSAMDEPFWTNQKFAVVGIGLAFLGVAVGIGQWLIPPDQLSGEIKFGLIVLACTLAMVGCGLLVQAFLPPATNPTKRLVAAIRVGAVLGLVVIIGYNQFPIKAPSIPAVNPKTDPQSPVPAPIQKPSEVAPTIPEKVNPAPRKTTPPALTVPRKQRTAPPADIKSDPPTTLQAPKESVTDKPDKPIGTAQTAPIEATPIQPKETLADILIRKCPAATDPADPVMERFPRDFIREWLGVIKTVSGRPKKELQTVMQVRPRLRDHISDDAHLAEAIFTLRCLESADYIRIMETSDPLLGRLGRVINNLKFEFVTEEKRNEFLQGL